MVHSPVPESFGANLARLKLEPGGALVAVSGGPDSLALLDLLVNDRASHGLELTVGHVDHGIDPESARVAARVEALAQDYGLACLVRRLDLGSDASETVARDHRHRALRAMKEEVGASHIMLGHTRDDQVETVLMRVLRGSGPAGLAGMSARTGDRVRPLLPFRRSDLAQYLQSRGLEWWRDPANEDERHLRSWIRARLVPLLGSRMPDADDDIVSLASQAAGNRAAWDAVLDVLPGLDWREETDGGSVAAAGLVGYDSPLGTSLVGTMARRVGCVVGPTRTARVLALAARGRSGATLELLAGWRVESAFGRVRFFRPCSGPVPAPLVLDSSGTGLGDGVWGRWCLTWRLEIAPPRQPRGGNHAWFVPGRLTVRAWRSGDRIHPLGGTGHRSVARCLQEARVPRSHRAGWPVLEAEGAVVWVPGVCRSAELVPPPGTEALRVDVAFT